jgi:predicted metal-dependent peptidase
MTMALSAREKLSAAIMRVVEPPVALAPYFGAVLRGLVRRELSADEENEMLAMGRMPTLSVSKDGIMRWSPSFVDKIDVQMLAVCLVHEIMHVVLKHFERAEAIGIVPEPTADYMNRAYISNIAQDLAINTELTKTMKMPDFVCLPEKYKLPPGLMFEEYYPLLLKLQEKMPPPPGGAGGGWCGGCAGHPAPGEPEGGKSEEGRSEAEMERFRKAVAQDIQATKDRGKIPDSLNRFADALLAPPKVDWRTKLARTLRGAVAYKSGQSDFTWNRMSRRQAGVGYGIGRPVLPALHSPVPSVGVIVDTSGSVSEAGLAAAASEIQGILSAVGATITVVAVDADVQNVKECKTIADAVRSFKGGGGTIMTPGFEALEKMKSRPSVVVCLTDGAIGDGYPETEPSWCKTIWVVIEGSGEPCCPWGEYINVEID